VTAGDDFPYKKPDIAEWFYIPTWKREIALANPTGRMPERSRWLLFIDECDIGSRVVQQLHREGHEVISVKAGPEFSRLDESVYMLAPGYRDHYDALFNELRIKSKIPNNIIHLWNVTRKSQTEMDSQLVNMALDRSFYSLLFLAQALGKQNLTDEIRIAVVSNNMQDVTGDDALCPEKATLLGPCRVIPQECSNIRCRSIDITLSPERGAEIEEWIVAELIGEFTSWRSDVVIAYRGSSRWVESFEPVRLSEEMEKTPRLRQAGVYLIPGGLGGIGLTLAEFLAKTVQAKLILVGRSAFPDRKQWEQWVADHGEQDAVSHKIRKVQHLIALGAEVFVAQADVADLQQMQAVINKAKDRFGKINGVIHAAGLIGTETFCAIQEATRAACEQQFRPKIYGLLVLSKIFCDMNLDFCLLCSSLASILGGLGFIAYSAANVFMDAFVNQHRRTRHQRWTSVDWDGWTFTDGKQSLRTAVEWHALSMTTEEGSKAFQAVLSRSELNQVVVSTGDLQRRISQWVKLKSLRRGDKDSRKETIALHPRPNLSSVYVAPRNAAERTIALIWQELLGIVQVGIDDNFFELGGDSLLGIQLVSRLNKEFKVKISAVGLYEAPTVRSIGKLLCSNEASRETAEQRSSRGARRRERSKQRLNNPEKPL
jgi:NAD(P)-dependent dehydrogenase (short-subunit alcohol dehydrogenase family)/acyl carrier protein